MLVGLLTQPASKANFPYYSPPDLSGSKYMINNHFGKVKRIAKDIGVVGFNPIYCSRKEMKNRGAIFQNKAILFSQPQLCV